LASGLFSDNYAWGGHGFDLFSDALKSCRFLAECMPMRELLQGPAFITVMVSEWFRGVAAAFVLDPGLRPLVFREHPAICYLLRFRVVLPQLLSRSAGGGYSCSASPARPWALQDWISKSWSDLHRRRPSKSTAQAACIQAGLA
jgi:hypothetical protein